MKEVKEWNGKPRWMWVWDYDANRKEKRYVLCILTDEEMKEGNATFPVCSYDMNFKHCAEIEEEKRPCTREELLEMLNEQGLPMLKWYNDSIYLVDNLFKENCKIDNVLYNYSELCKDFTLIDGTELWVEE